MWEIFTNISPWMWPFFTVHVGKLYIGKWETQKPLGSFCNLCKVLELWNKPNYMVWLAWRRLNKNISQHPNWLNEDQPDFPHVGSCVWSRDPSCVRVCLQTPGKEAHVHSFRSKSQRGGHLTIGAFYRKQVYGLCFEEAACSARELAGECSLFQFWIVLMLSFPTSVP